MLAVGCWPQADGGGVLFTSSNHLLLLPVGAGGFRKLFRPPFSPHPTSKALGLTPGHRPLALLRPEARSGEPGPAWGAQT